MRAPPVLERAVRARIAFALSVSLLNSVVTAHRRGLVPAQRCASGAHELSQDAQAKA